MNRLIILSLITITLAGCATGTHNGGAPSGPIARIEGLVAPSSAPSDPMSAETKPVDLLVREILTPAFVEHANEAIAINPTDVVFVQCLRFKLDLRDELIAKPLLAVPHLALVTADPSCLLCVAAAKRKDLELAESGALTAQIAEVRTRVRAIRKRKAIACGPLLMEEEDLLGHAVDLIGGLLHGH